MTLLIIVAAITCLILLISWGRMHAFLAFVIVSLATGMMLGIPPATVAQSVQKGMGDMLGSLVLIICLGAMLGKLVAESGAAQRIADSLLRLFGQKYLTWAMMGTGLVVGIPLFYNVGFVLLVPLVFSVVYQTRQPAVYVGIPLLAALSVTHGFLPPHPSPTAMVPQFGADLGRTLLYGLLIALPTIVLAGPVFARFLKKIPSQPLQSFQPKLLDKTALPGTANSIITALLPVILLLLTTLYSGGNTDHMPQVLRLLTDPAVVMLLAVLYATWSLGLLQGKKMTTLTTYFSEAIRDVAPILLIVSGAGALKQVLTDSEVSIVLADTIRHWSVHPLILGWFMAAFIRACVGSATVAGLTAAGILAPLVASSGVDPNLMVISIGAGSLFFSHVNDAGFWMYKEYFNLSMKHTFLSWSVMETLVSVLGLLGVLLLNILKNINS